MEKPEPALLHRASSAHVLFRFVFRFTLLSAFAALGPQLFVTALAQFLALAAIFCAIAAAVRRESMFGPVLTHWDEALVCAITGHLLFKLQ